MVRRASSRTPREAASEVGVGLPRPTRSFRLRAWRWFQRSLDPLAEPRRLPVVRGKRDP